MGVLLKTVLLDEESSSLMPNVAMSRITICARTHNGISGAQLARQEPWETQR